MRDDELLRQLADLARQEEEEENRLPLDPRWDALAAGTLPPAEAEALRAEAEASPEKRAAYEAFAPLGEEFRERMVATARAGLAPAAPAKSAAAPRSSPAPRLPLDRRQRRLWLSGTAAAVVLAATVVLVLLLPGLGSEPLPPYAARLAGGTQEWRGGETEVPAAEAPAVPVFAPGNRLELLFRPERAVGGRLAVETFVSRDGGLVPWTAPVEISEHGAVRLEGVIGEEVRLPPGEATLVVAIGRAGSLPGAAALAARLRELPRRGGAACLPVAREALLCAATVVLRRER
ncbi:MAG TPA: hypothetical protein VGC93_12875 [Thermoanaerobaculia bacterium]